MHCILVRTHQLLAVGRANVVALASRHPCIKGFFVFRNDYEDSRQILRKGNYPPYPPDNFHFLTSYLSLVDIEMSMCLIFASLILKWARVKKYVTAEQSQEAIYRCPAEPSDLRLYDFDVTGKS